MTENASKRLSLETPRLGTRFVPVPESSDIRIHPQVSGPGDRATQSR